MPRTVTMKLNHDDHGMQHAERHDTHHAHGGSGRPMFAAVTMRVSHCGPGVRVVRYIVSLDSETIMLVGEQTQLDSVTCTLIYPAQFSFTFAFGIAFQYFPVAPVLGDYALKTLILALMTDTWLLLFFEIELFWLDDRTSIWQARPPERSKNYMLDVPQYL
jgi:hypothetical protein